MTGNEVIVNNKPFFVLMWTLTLVIAGVLIFIGISLIPFFHQIGLAATVVVFIFLGYGTVGGGGFLAFKLYQWWLYRRVIISGDVVSFRDDDGEWEHLSAEHERAKAPRMITAAAEPEKLETPESDIVQMYNDGEMTLERIADQCNMTYYKVQRIVSDAKKKGLIHRK
jgi:hypothetical protein